MDAHSSRSPTILALALTLLLSACARPSTPGAGGPPDSPVSSTPGPGGGGGTGGPTPVAPRPGMADVRAIAWERIDVGNDDRTLTVYFTSGIEPCYVLDRVDVEYGVNTVTVTLFEGHDPTAGNVACIEIGVFKVTTVVLDEPLAGRELVDGAEQK